MNSIGIKNEIWYFRYMILILLALMVSFSISNGQTVLVPKNSNWKYLDDGTDQGTAWKGSGFDDSGWASGNAELGYGDGDETTVISYGSDSNNKYITYYFRHEFNVSDPDATSYLDLKLLRDDGAVVYINGTEVVRSNMPSGTIDYLTVASSSVGGGDEDTFYDFIISSDPLVSGSNCIAVELHQRSHSSSDISFNLELDTTSQTVQLFRKAPYLIYSGVNTEMIILWQLTDTYNCTIKWGTDETYSSGTTTTNEYGDDHQHKITLTGLLNSTKYYYMVVAEGDTSKGDFLTGPSGDQTEITILAYGDTRTYPASHNKVAEQIIINYNNNPDQQTLLINSGDLVSSGETESDWDDQFFDPQYLNIQNMLRSIPLMAAKGNHEGSGTLFSKYFPYPFYNSGTYYYSFDYGPVHVCVVDQYTDYSVGSTQYQWLENDLATTDKKWKILAFHEPGWSAGGHSNNTQVQNVIQPLCEEYDVQFVINGHNHYYSRAVVERVNHVTTGGGGAPLYSPDPSYPNIVKAQESHHYCKLEFTPDTLYFSVIDDNGNNIETVIYNRIYTWNGSVDNNWNNENNWEMGVVPKTVSEVFIPSGLSNYPEIDSEVSCRKIRLENGAFLTVLSSGKLNVH